MSKRRILGLSKHKTCSWATYYQFKLILAKVTWNLTYLLVEGNNVNDSYMKLGISSTFQVVNLTKERCVFLYFNINILFWNLQIRVQFHVPSKSGKKHQRTKVWTLFHMEMCANFSWRNKTNNQHEWYSWSLRKGTWHVFILETGNWLLFYSK